MIQDLLTTLPRPLDSLVVLLPQLGGDRDDRRGEAREAAFPGVRRGVGAGLWEHVLAGLIAAFSHEVAGSGRLPLALNVVTDARGLCHQRPGAFFRIRPGSSLIARPLQLIAMLDRS